MGAMSSGMPEVQITPAAPDDAEWCARLMASSEPWLTLRRDYNAACAALRLPGRELFLARQDNQPVGFILLSPHGLAASPYINSIAVDPGFRGRGVGTALLNFAERHFAGRKHLFLLVSSFNKKAQNLYRRHGYAFVGELKGYVVPEHDELIFCKKLANVERGR